MNIFRNSKTAGELIAELQQYNPETPVLIGYDYGDHWHSQVTPDIDDVQELNIKYSDYHRMNKIDDEEESEFKAIVLRSRR